MAVSDPWLLRQALTERAQEALQAPQPTEALALLVRVPSRRTEPAMTWNRALPASQPPAPAGTVTRLADLMWQQCAQADLWADWPEAGWRVGATIAPGLLAALHGVTT